MVRERGLPLAGQLELHRVADLVRERAHVVHLIGEVQHHVGQRVLGDRGAERAPALARARLGVDALIAVETVRHGADARREVVERVGDERLGVLVGDGSRGAEGCVLVAQRELVQPEQLGLVPEPAVREVVMALDGREQDVDRLARQLVVEVARRARMRVAPHPVEHEPVGHERVVDVGQHGRLRLERGEERLVGRQARLAHGPAHAREHLIDRALLALERDAQRRGHLIEERVPGAGGGGVALGEHLLLGLAARVRRKAARAGEVVAVAREALVGEQALGMGLVDRDPLQLEEAQRVQRLDQRHLDLGVEVALLLAADVHGQAQAGEGGQPREAVVERRELLERRRELGRFQLGDAAAVALAEGVAVIEQRRDHGARGVRVCEQRGEIPVNPGAGGRSGAHRATP